MVPIPYCTAGEVTGMSVVIWYAQLLTDEDDCSVADIVSWILLQSHKIVNQLVFVLDIEFRESDGSIFDRLNKHGQTSGFIYCVVIVIRLLLRVVETYYISSLGSCIRKRNGHCLGEQKSTLLHHLHPEESCARIVVCKHIRLQHIYPAHKLLRLLCRSSRLLPSFPKEHIYSIAVCSQSSYCGCSKRL